MCDTPEKIYSPGGTDNGQFGHTHARYVFMTQNILTLCNMPVLSFLILVRNFESMVAVLSPNLRLWETFDRIYCQVLHINCPTHRLPCHSLQRTSITCDFLSNSLTPTSLNWVMRRPSTFCPSDPTGDRQSDLQTLANAQQ